MKNIITVIVIALFFVQCSHKQQQIDLPKCLIQGLLDSPYTQITNINRVVQKDTVLDVYSRFQPYMGAGLEEYKGDSVLYLKYEKYVGNIFLNKINIPFSIEYLINTKKSRVNKYLYQVVLDDNSIAIAESRRERIILLNNIIVRVETDIDLKYYLSTVHDNMVDNYINNCSACNCNEL